METDLQPRWTDAQADLTQRIRTIYDLYKGGLTEFFEAVSRVRKEQEASIRVRKLLVTKAQMAKADAVVCGSRSKP